jgi:hypothetical protein
MAFRLLVCDIDERARPLLGKKDMSLRMQRRQEVCSYDSVRGGHLYRFIILLYSVYHQGEQISTDQYGSSVGTVGAINAPA